MRKLTVALVLSCGLAPRPALAQKTSWQHKWYWGAQAGVLLFKTPADSGWDNAVTAGGHWLITGSRSALYVAYDQIFFSSGTTSSVTDATGIQPVQFKRGRRVQAQLMVIPTDNPLQFYFGGGFGINQVIGAAPTTLGGTTAQQQALLQTVDQASTKAFFVLSGGAQLRYGRTALFAQYQFTPENRDYLLSATQHQFSAGLRYAVTTSREEVTSRP